MQKYKGLYLEVLGITIQETQIKIAPNQYSKESSVDLVQDSRNPFFGATSVGTENYVTRAMWLMEDKEKNART